MSISKNPLQATCLALLLSPFCFLSWPSTLRGQNPDLNVRWTLSDGSGVAGGRVRIYFTVEADAATQGFSYSVDFDETVLQVAGREDLWQRPDGKDFQFVHFTFNNDDLIYGSVGIDEGFLVGAVVIGGGPSQTLPAHTETPFMAFDFAVRDIATPGHEAEVLFLDGGQTVGQPVPNIHTSFGISYTPEMATSFVFVGGLLNIVAATPRFVRGDPNFDGSINISDGVNILQYLFSDFEISCLDAADTNDIDDLDLTDGIHVLRYLMTAGLPPPPPGPVGTTAGAAQCGVDTTDDGLGCDTGAPYCE